MTSSVSSLEATTTATTATTATATATTATATATALSSNMNLLKQWIVFTNQPSSLRYYAFAAGFLGSFQSLRDIKDSPCLSTLNGVLSGLLLIIGSHVTLLFLPNSCSIILNYMLCAASAARFLDLLFTLLFTRDSTRQRSRCNHNTNDSDELQ